MPALVVFAGFGQRLAHGTSLAAIVPISVAGTIGYATVGEVEWPAVVAMVAGGLAGSVIGTHLLDRLPQERLQLGFAVVMLLTAIRLLFETPDGGVPPDLGVAVIAGYVALGLASGALAGVMGVGGGVIMVPALTILAGFPLVIAKGTSLAVIVPTAVARCGTARRRTSTCAPCTVVGLSGVISSFAASKLSLGLDPDLSAASFAVLLAVTVAQMFRMARRHTPVEETVM